ncbi:uncharacterized protein LOC110676625 [Aedes aegypti]|uniref:Uncharacterized protein n=1 Tax=Aedes aegypti TaxID=7159 RepID=A0A6I8TSA9_AEDAE|nr:uncharacterized protein LOC110676625 [Aedes aegypti]
MEEKMYQLQRVLFGYYRSVRSAVGQILSSQFEMISILVLLVAVVCSVSAQTKFVTLDNVKYSYGIFAPVGLTVGSYVWYISALGLILGALVLLYFSKSWNSSSAYYNGIFGRRSMDYQRAFGESSLFDDLDSRMDTESQELFWKDRIRDIAKLFQEYY